MCRCKQEPVSGLDGLVRVTDPPHPRKPACKYSTVKGCRIVWISFFLSLFCRRRFRRVGHGRERTAYDSARGARHCPVSKRRFVWSVIREEQGVQIFSGPRITPYDGYATPAPCEPGRYPYGLVPGESGQSTVITATVGTRVTSVGYMPDLGSLTDSQELYFYRPESSTRVGPGI